MYSTGTGLHLALPPPTGITSTATIFPSHPFFFILLFSLYVLLPSSFSLFIGRSRRKKMIVCSSSPLLLPFYTLQTSPPPPFLTPLTSLYLSLFLDFFLLN